MPDMSAEAATFERVRRRLLAAGILGGFGARTAVLALTARLPGEGVTTVAIGLARAVSAAGDAVLLLDAVGGPQGAAATLGAAPTPLVVAAAGANTVDLEEHIVAGAANAAGVDLALVQKHGDFAAWAPLLDQLRSRYPLVIIDAGSLQSGDPYFWAMAADHSVLVLDPAKATYEVLERFRASLEGSSLQLAGFIMNRRPFPVPERIYRFATQGQGS